MHGRVPFAQRGPGRSYRPAPPPLSLRGEHPPGITSAPHDHLSIAAFDADRRELPSGWLETADRLTHAGLTLTLGVGTRPLPSFATDRLDPAATGGDLCILAASTDPEEAQDAIAEIAHRRPRWTIAGRLGPRERPGGNPRDALGFRHGTGNLRRGVDFDRHVWTRDGGTYLAVRHIRIDATVWNALPVTEQERIVGRHKTTGAPLGGRREYDTTPPLPSTSHAGLAHAQPARFLRRGYTTPEGLLLLVFTNDPAQRLVPVLRALEDGDPLNAFSATIGSAVFRIPAFNAR